MDKRAMATSPTPKSSFSTLQSITVTNKGSMAASPLMHSKISLKFAEGTGISNIVPIYDFTLLS